ncbi:MAG: uracil-DNA glycosylase [Anderseniella sp.]|nr:uracil-DNA glycosylase [Anderseniella sp.]
MSYGFAADAAKALNWLAAMGADEAIAGVPFNRFDESAALSAAANLNPAPAPADQPRRSLNHRPSAPPVAPAPPRSPAPAAVAIPAEELDAMAKSCGSLDDLARLLDGFDACPLKRTATQLCFADGLPGAHLMIVGEAPGRDEDEQGRPFVGRSGQLLDKMLNAAGFDRNSDEPASSVFITNAVFWRPPGNRNPSTAELTMCLPFVRRAIELAGPRLIMTAGNIPTQALLGTSQGITRTRGSWKHLEIGGQTYDVLPTLHPSYLLRSPEAKRLAWADLLEVKTTLTSR